MKDNIKRIVAAVLACLICLSTLAFNAFADGSTYTVSTAEGLTNALSEIGASGTGTIILNADLSDVGSIGISGSKTVTILGKGHSVSFKAGDYCLDVSGSATLNLGDPSNISASNLTLTKAASGESPGVLGIRGNAKVNMYDGVTIKDAKNNNYYGGGVTLGGQSSASNKAVFHMYGGTIDNCGVDGGSVCYGGGVAVCNGGTFIMDGGTISNCYAKTTYNSTNWQIPAGAGGGVFVAGGSSFIMNGGSISQCEASNSGGGVAVLNTRNSVTNHGAWGYLDSVYVMYGGIIRDCSSGLTGGGVSVMGTYCDVDAICAPNPESSTVDNPGLLISGGTIDCNKTGLYGGGIFIYGIQPTIPLSIHGITMEQNTATADDSIGGAICVFGCIGLGTYNMSKCDIKDATIVKNTAAQGGGLALYKTLAAMSTVADTVLANNRATDGGADVYVYASATALSNPAYMGVAYTGGPSNVTGRQVSGWFEDWTGYRFEDLGVTGCYEFAESEYTSIPSNVEYMLIAAPTPSTTVSGSFDLTKEFVVKDGYDDAGSVISNIEEKVTVDPEFVIEKLNSFNRVVGKDPLNDIPAFSESSYTIPVSSGEDFITIELPDYSAAGVGDYWYTVTESSLSGTAGVSDDTKNPRYLHIQVIWGNAEQTWMTIGGISLHKTPPQPDGSYENDSDDKSSGFTNTYGAGTLTVTKKVSGNMADPNKLFKVTVTLSAPTSKTVKSTVSYSGGFTDEGGLTALNGTIDGSGWTGEKSVVVWLKDGATITFTNIPDGVSYTVVEAEITGDSYVTEYEIQNGETDDEVLTNSVSGKISDSLDEIIITNRKKVPLDVGVILQNTPFLILLAGGIAVLVALPIVNRKKKYDEDI